MHTINLVVPPFTCASGDERMPMGAAYLSSALKQKKISVSCIDTRFEEVDFDCEFMGVTVWTQVFSYVKKLVKSAKEKGIKTIAGGPHCKADPMSLIKIGFDAVIVGEGEIALPELIESFKEGIHYAEPIFDIDRLPFPDMELFNKYPYRKDTAWILTSRGCPNECSYCQHFFKNRVRLRSVENILSEIERYGRRAVEIIDDCFTINKDRVYNFCKNIHRLNYASIVLSNGTIATTLDEKMVEALSNARLTNMMIGMESIDREVIRMANRRVYREDCEKVILWCKKNNIRLGIFMIIGLPGSSYESDIKGVEWICSQNVSSNYGVAIPFRNTMLWDWIEKNGRWLTNPYDYENYPPKFEMKDYMGSDIQKVFEIAVKATSRIRQGNNARTCCEKLG